jgi:hypothetical protein
MSSVVVLCEDGNLVGLVEGWVVDPSGLKLPRHHQLREVDSDKDPEGAGAEEALMTEADSEDAAEVAISEVGDTAGIEAVEVFVVVVAAVMVAEVEVTLGEEEETLGEEEEGVTSEEAEAEDSEADVTTLEGTGL